MCFCFCLSFLITTSLSSSQNNWNLWQLPKIVLFKCYTLFIFFFTFFRLKLLLKRNETNKRIKTIIKFKVYLWCINGINNWIIGLVVSSTTKYWNNQMKCIVVTLGRINMHLRTHVSRVIFIVWYVLLKRQSP